MKICVVTTGHRPDDDRIYYKEILSLLCRHPRIDLVAPVRAGERYDLKPGVILHPFRRRRGAAGRIVMLLAAAARVVGMRPDVCHFHDLDFVAMAPLIRLLTRARIVYDSHEVYPESMLISPNIPASLRPLAARIVNLVEKACARSCARIVTADEPNAASFEVTRVPSVVLFNYPRLSLFEAGADRIAAVKRQFPGRRILIYQGTMGVDRGLFHMLDGMVHLKARVPDALLLLVGLNDPTLRAAADDRIRRSGIEAHVHVIPWVPHTELAAYISASDVGLVPWQPSQKNRKNIPIKVFEYMACGVPLLAADLPSIAHYVRESGAGLLYDSTDSRAFAEGAVALLADEDRQGAMGDAGRVAVRDRWNWDAMGARLLALYAEMEGA